MTLAAGTPIGKYVVRRKIAEGGMAEIYLCASKGPEGFEKEVVIKRIRAFLATDQSFVEMFIREAQLASWLNHPNIVQIFDFDKHEDTYYLAMEYVHGRSLWELRKKTKELLTPLPPVLVAHIGSEVARALHFAHLLKQKGKPVGIVHRDVTPHNVLLSFDGAVKLTDFGIAKVDKTGTAPGMLKGKFAYMSPEQARGDAVDARTDVFALGIVLWEMLTGGRLFDADSELGTLKAVQQSVIPPPSRVNPDVPEELSAIVLKALERELGARYATAQDLERALKQFVLKNADSVDDTDVGGYLRKLFPEEATQVRGMSISLSSITPPNAAEPPKPAAPEPTAVKGKPLTPPPRPSVEQTNVLEKPKGSPPTERLPSVGKVKAPPATRQERSVRRDSQPEMNAVDPAATESVDEEQIPAAVDPTLIVRRASMTQPVVDEADPAGEVDAASGVAPLPESEASPALPPKPAGPSAMQPSNRAGASTAEAPKKSDPSAGELPKKSTPRSSGETTLPLDAAATERGLTSGPANAPEISDPVTAPPEASPAQSGPTLSLHTSAGAEAPRPQPGSPGFAQVRAEVERSSPPAKSSKKGLYAAAAVFLLGAGIAVAVGLKSASSSQSGGGGEGEQTAAVLPQLPPHEPTLLHDAGNDTADQPMLAAIEKDSAEAVAMRDAGKVLEIAGASELNDAGAVVENSGGLGAGHDAAAQSSGHDLSAQGSAHDASAQGSDHARDAGTAAVAQVAAKRVGTLKLSVVPWAKVSIDGVSRGEIQSPRTFTLEVGEHRLKLEHPRGAKSQRITISAGQTTPVLVNMLQQ